MLVNADVTGLEVVVAADRYDDKVLKQELLDGIDIHQTNMERFKLPKRVVAKVLKFRTIYGGNEFSFANDPLFQEVSPDVKYWKKVLAEYFAKYHGIASGHERDIQFVKDNGFLETPSGRFYNYKPTYKYGDWKWPLTTIKNYPIQGFGADLVKLARIEFYNNFVASGLEGDFISTIHDSLVADVPDKNIMAVATMLRDAIVAVPRLCKEHYDYDFSLPLKCEVQYGRNKLDMQEIVW